MGNCYSDNADSAAMQLQKELHKLKKRGKFCRKTWAAARKAERAEEHLDVHKAQSLHGSEVHDVQGNPIHAAAMPLILNARDIGGNSLPPLSESHRELYAARATSTNAEQRRARLLEFFSDTHSQKLQKCTSSARCCSTMVVECQVMVAMVIPRG